MKELNKGLRKKVRDAIRKGKIEQRDGIYRFSDRIGNIPRGTVIIGERVVYGYPKIRRVFSLSRGAERNLENKETWVEEKIDGFNLRVACEGGELVCLSRGGFLDYFATEKILDMEEVVEFFKDHPEKVLHMEMVGCTPYTPPAKKYDVKYYVFDISDGKLDFSSTREKRKLCRKYGMESAPLVKKLENPDSRELKKAAIQVERSGGEGIVLKQQNPRKIIKYVVPSSEIEDLAKNSHMIFDMPAGFMKQRVFRSAISISELGLDKDKYDERMGRALHKNLYTAIKKGGEVSEKFEVLVKKKKIWKKVLEHMSDEVRIEVDSEKKENGGTRIKFRKVYKKGSRRVRRAIKGYAQAD
ncbi:MAG: RNA ligase [Candidatus Micrarchaeia archaeon]